MDMDSSILLHFDPSDLGSLILIQITPKEVPIDTARLALQISLDHAKYNLCSFCTICCVQVDKYNSGRQVKSEKRENTKVKMIHNKDNVIYFVTFR